MHPNSNTLAPGIWVNNIRSHWPKHKIQYKVSGNIDAWQLHTTIQQFPLVFKWSCEFAANRYRSFLLMSVHIVHLFIRYDIYAENILVIAFKFWINATAVATQIVICIYGFTYLFQLDFVSFYCIYTCLPACVCVCMLRVVRWDTLDKVLLR